MSEQQLFFPLKREHMKCRKCLICGSTNEHRAKNTNVARWYRMRGGWKCHRCYQKIRYDNGYYRKYMKYYRAKKSEERWKRIAEEQGVKY